MVESRARAEETIKQGKPVNWLAAVIIILLWLLLAAWFVTFLLRIFQGKS
jgi:hypothetical protein